MATPPIPPKPTGVRAGVDQTVPPPWLRRTDTPSEEESAQTRSMSVSASMSPAAIVPPEGSAAAMVTRGARVPVPVFRYRKMRVSI